MEKIKAYFDPERGYLLFRPDGSTIPYDTIKIEGDYIDAGSKAGHTMLFAGSRATITFDVEVVNEHPNKNMPTV